MLPYLSEILTIVYEIIEDCLVLFVVEVGREVANEQSNVGPVGVLLQLQVEPGQLLNNQSEVSS